MGNTTHTEIMPIDMPFRQLLRILEGYPVQVPIKGGYRLWRPKVVFFTSDIHPNGWQFIKDTVSRTRQLLSPTEQSQLYRRITRIFHARGLQAQLPLGNLHGQAGAVEPPESDWVIDFDAERLVMPDI